MTTAACKMGQCGPKGTLVGRGSSCMVYRSRLPNSDLVAVKEYVFSNVDEDTAVVRDAALAELLSEAEEILLNEEALPRHPHIASILGVEFIPSSAGNLSRLLVTVEWVEHEARKGKPTLLDEALCRRVTRELLEAIDFLHQQGVTHDDVKPSNVLLTNVWDRRPEGSPEAWTVLVDHRLSKYIRRLVDPAIAATTMQSPNYCPPEIFTEGKEYDAEKCDVWGVGTVLLEFLSGKKPWSELDPTGRGNIMFRVLQSRNPPAYPKDISQEATSFLDACFMRNYEDRPSVEQLLEYPWVSRT